VAIASSETSPPSLLRQGLPGELEEVILRAMAREPEDRFERASQFLEALAPFVYDSEMLSSDSHSAIVNPANQSYTPGPAVATAERRTSAGGIPKRAWTVGAIIVIAAAGGLWLYANRGEEPHREGTPAVTLSPVDASIHSKTDRANPNDIVGKVATESTDADQEVTTTKLVVEVEPPHAKISIDGEEVEGNPFIAPMVKRGSEIRIEAWAPGYVKTSRTVVMNDDQNVELRLERETKRVMSPPSDGRLPRPGKSGKGSQWLVNEPNPYE